MTPIMGSVRQIAIGYDTDEVSLPEKPNLKTGARVTRPRKRGLLRRAVWVALAICLVGVCLPTVNPDNQWNVREGCQVRFARSVPIPHCFTALRGGGKQVNISRAGLRRFVSCWLVKNMPRLSSETDTTVESWLEQCTYRPWRKKQLQETFEDFQSKGMPKHRLFRNKSFQKWESYTDVKFPRAINSRSDAFKCLVGPIFKAIEKSLFSLDYFIKKISVSSRPEYIHGKLYRDGGVYMATDYTAFESLFTEEFMTCVEFQLYEHMVRDIPAGRAWLHLVEDAMLGPNVCKFKEFSVVVPGTRMSGEMCTSLGNSFANLMVALYVLECYGTKDPQGFVEGDDALFRVDGDFPPKEAFEALGLLIKIERHTELSEASFCGLIFDPEEMLNVTDPRQLLASFGWAHGSYAMASERILAQLQVAKALSYLHQYPGCPIVQELALTTLRLVRCDWISALDRAQRTANQYDTDLYDAIKRSFPVAVDVGPRTRLLVERKFGVSIEQQLSIEASLRGMVKPGPFEADLGYPVSWVTYFSRYVITSEPGAAAHLVQWPRVRDQTTDTRPSR